MDKKKTERAVMRTVFTKLCKEIEGLLTDKNYKRIDVETKFIILDSKYQKLKKLDEDMFQLMIGEADESLIEKEMATCDEYEVRFIHLKLCIVNIGQDKSQIITEAPRYKLPKIKLKKFNGELSEWLGFWSQFSKIHEDSSLAPEDKFQYLIQSTEEGTKAREIVQSFPPTGLNYPKVIESLKDRFGQEDMLVEVYVRELLKLVIKNVANPLPIHDVYDKVESAMRALESLGITSEKCAPLLYPLVESSLSEDILRTYRRNIDTDPTPTGRLEKLMKFLKNEVDAEQRISMAMDGFGLGRKDLKSRNRILRNEELITASEFLVQNEKKFPCIFCSKMHHSSDCFRAQKMPFDEKQKILKTKHACFSCLKIGHNSKRCKAKLKCIICSKHHDPLMCPTLCEKRDEHGETVSNDRVKEQSSSSLANFVKRPKIILQTLKLDARGSVKCIPVRALIDTGSERSYILKQTALRLGCIPLGQETIIHSLFGEHKTKESNHLRYRVELGSINGSYAQKFEVLDQPIICSDVSSIKQGSWMKEIKDLNIEITDTDCQPGPIEILLGADIAANVLTGKQVKLSNGLLATETHFGWTLMGKLSSSSNNENLAMQVTSLFIREASISDLWNLDVIGITDSTQKKLKLEEDFNTKMKFLKSVTVNEGGRYEVALPWKEEHLPLPSYKDLALGRLEKMTKRLYSENLYPKYDEALEEWHNLGIIEEVPPEEIKVLGCYLPHRPVVKQYGTTKIRPVFDASAREKAMPSLNQCLNCGPNLLQLIPNLLLRFREKKYGVSADIEKAFLQISIQKIDRNFLRFLWWTKDGNLRIFRHTRVVFGVISSPYLLGAVIDLHLRKYSDCPNYDASMINKLRNSFYVDNVVASVDNERELLQFIENGKTIMSEGKFNLRDWQHTGERDVLPSTVLGISWNRKDDRLSIKLDWLKHFQLSDITKRSILSITHKVFDPVGFVCPALLFPKLLLQKLCTQGISWDSKVDVEAENKFQTWFKGLSLLEEVSIPRWFNISSNEMQYISLHTFCDASQHAYAAAVFIRVEKEHTVEVSLLAAKSRVAPPKAITVPRLELIAALIGARLCVSVVEGLNYSDRSDLSLNFWTDSTTVLAWIQKEEVWSVFVNNRVKEIRSLTTPECWRHVPGEVNPADLPSRGCSFQQLVTSRWWEGPSWLRDSPTNWPSSDSTYDLKAISQEKRKTIITSTTCFFNKTPVYNSCSSSLEENNRCDLHKRNSYWYYRYFSCYGKLVRMVAWIRRFVFNCKTPSLNRKSGELSNEEYCEAEKKIIKLVQDETFACDTRRELKSLNVYKDEQGILRLRTKLVHRKDTQDFRNPVLLPSHHSVVERLIMTEHKRHAHAGTQILLNILRERYWVINGRKTIRRVISKCSICKRHKGDHLNAPTAPLPENRISDSAVFEIVGIDMAGPLYLKGEIKAWICLFTCAVYRAIHLELVTAISTESFFQALRRFISRRGRPNIIYCDNGTNFVGASNALNAIDWNEVLKRSILQKIEWRFNPPSAPWWGGWWERLVGIVKQLLRKVLKKAYFSFEEMTTILCDVEAVINSRSLTYIAESDELVALSPNLFLHDIRNLSVQDCDEVDMKSLNKRLRYRQKIMSDLRNRFRSEYLGFLIQKKESKSYKNDISVGDVVLIGCENIKRINWPLGHVIELIPGSDNIVRLARVQTANKTELLRPIQRIFPLEVSSSWVGNIQNPRKFTPAVQSTKETEGLLPEGYPDDVQESIPPVCTRSGRIVKIPDKLDL